MNRRTSGCVMPNKASGCGEGWKRDISWTRDETIRAWGVGGGMRRWLSVHLEAFNIATRTAPWFIAVAGIGKKNGRSLK